MQEGDVIKENAEESSKAPKSRKTRRNQRYELLEQVGKGTMGTVHRAHDRKLNRTVAVKILNPEYASGLSGLFRLKRELALASRVTAPEVVRVYDIGQRDGQPLISMDWIDGESLASLLSRVHSLPPSQVYDLASQACKALIAIHSAAIVHRDFKPGNLLVTRTGDLRVTDFGLARSNQPQDATITAPGYSCGTPRYMAPEQLAGLQATVRSDIYSFGLIVLEMLTGETVLEALDPIRHRLLELKAGRNARSQEMYKLALLDNVIRGCVRQGSSERYPSAEAVLADLMRHDTDLTPQAETSQRTVRRFRGKLGIAAALAIGLLAVTTFRVSNKYANAPAEPASNPSQQASSDQLYAQAMSLMAPGSGELELNTAERELNESLAQRPNFLPAVQALLDVRIRLYEATADRKWLSEARQALQGPAASSLTDQQRTLLQGRIDLDAHRFSQVVHALQNNQMLLDTSPEANSFLGRALDGLGQHAAALPFYRTAVRLGPECWVCHNDLGAALMNAGLIEQARAEFVRVAELRPTSYVGFSNLGAAILSAGDPQGARESFEKALERQTPPPPPAYFNLGLSTYYSRDFASSVPFFETCIRMRPDSGLYMFGLANALWHLKRGDAARKAYVTAITLLDALEEKQQLTTEQSCHRAVCFARIGDSQAAQATLDGVARRQPEDLNVLYTGAVLAVAAGRKEYGKQLLANALRHGYSARLARIDPDLEEIF